MGSILTKNPNYYIGLSIAGTLLASFTSVPSKIDLNLAVLDTILPSGESLYCWQIAEIAGCSTQRIQQIEAKALAKLRRKLVKEMPEKITTRFKSKCKPRTAVERFQRWLAEVNPDLGISPS